MQDVLTQNSVAPRPPRAVGTLSLRCRPSPRGTEIADFRHSGSMKALFPRTSGPGLDAVFVNTAGGITGDDRFSINIAVADGARLTLTSQAAERAYRAQPGETGAFSVDLAVERRGRLNWLPQETLLYEHSALHRRMTVSIEAQSTFLAVEPIVFGREAMGEDLSRIAFREDWRLRRDGTLIYADSFRLDGDVAATLAHPAKLGTARAMASVVYAAPNAEAFLDPLRAMMTDTSGVSLIRPGVLFARFLAPDSFLLRKGLIPVLEVLNQSPLPRTWMI